MVMTALAESGYLPDALVRTGIRRLIGKRHAEILRSASSEALGGFVASSRSGPLAIETDSANDQHYEVPAEFFQRVLGPRLKYSGCLFPSEETTLAEAEIEMLRLTCERADLQDGMRILELGCGWGSLTLWMAEHYRSSEITAVSNSASQRKFIEGQAEKLGLGNIRVLTADMRSFETDSQFDRVVSVEMFEHMRNYQLLLNRISNWLCEDGKLFVHIFCHRDMPYFFETEGEDNWMGRHFFTGGTMPSFELLRQFSDDLIVENQWRINGNHYWKTCEAWLTNLDAQKQELVDILKQDCTKSEAWVRLQRWRMFFMACAELFHFRGGDEWFVGHYLLGKSDQT